MKLSNIIAKQIRKKHLNQDIRHAQTRHKYRNYKLKQDYNTPRSTHNRLYIYSNMHGNQFILRPSTFQTVSVQHSEILNIVKQIHRISNEQIYSLWLKNKNFSQTLFFPMNRRIIDNSAILIFFLFIFLAFAWLISAHHGDSIDYIRFISARITIFTILAIIIVCSVISCSTMRTQYKIFDYDHEIVKLMLSILGRYEQSLKGKGVEIECDRQITWICFKIKDQRREEQQFVQSKQAQSELEVDHSSSIQ